MLNLGLNDVYRHFYEDKEGYTFWDYMRGAWQNLLIAEKQAEPFTDRREIKENLTS